MELADKRTSIVYWGILSVFFAAYLWVHELAGFTFPIPWPDEGTFLWQALAVARDGTLFARQINPDRDIMWMPPGYMVATGLIFKLSGFSLAWARLLSALFTIAAMTALAAMLHSQSRARSHAIPHTLLYALLCGSFLMNRNFVFMGNMARPESLLLLIACSGFLLLHRGRLYAALALLWLSPLVHPNGVYFLGTACVYALIVLWRDPSRRAPGRRDVSLLAVAALCWLAYGLYAFGRWDDLVSDMGFTITWKGQSGIATASFWRAWIQPAALLRWFVLFAALLSAHRLALLRPAGSLKERGGDSALAALITLAFALQILGITTLGWMYRVHASLLILVLTLIVVAIGVEALEAGAERRTRAYARALAGVIAALAVGVNALLGEIEDPRRYPTHMTFEEMRISNSPPYFESRDLLEVGRFLESLESERGDGRDSGVLRVSVFPWGEAILYEAFETERVTFTQPTFHREKSDVSIVHLSRHLPDDPAVLRTPFMRKHVANWPVFHERDGSERWHYKIWTQAEQARR